MSFTPEKALELLRNAHQKNRLAHAYLITGPQGSGKEQLAIQMIEMANSPEGQTGPAASSLEDLRCGHVTVISPESKSRMIPVDTIRNAEHVLRMAAPTGLTKFAILRDADRMNDASSNAFLKTLEEPPSSSRLLLLTSAPEQLLDTILSRCICIPLRGASGPAELTEQIRRLLDTLKEQTESGRGGVAAGLHVMSNFSAILKEEKQAISKRNDSAQKEETARYQKTTEGDYLKRRETYYKALTEAQYLQERNRLTEYLVMWFGDALRQQHGSSHLDLPDYADATRKLAESLDANQLSQKVDQVQELRSHLNTNAFEPLVLEAGFIRIFS